MISNIKLCTVAVAFALLIITISNINIFLFHVQLTQVADKILLNCGGPPLATDHDGQKWITDIGSNFTSGGQNSTTSPAAALDPDFPAVPYMTGRVFWSPFTYTFPVAPGRKVLLLHFYPSSYAGLNISDARFSVTVQQSDMVMKNVSVIEALRDRKLKYGYMVHEYKINVTEDKKLRVTFTPSSASNYAFVNGIEVMSMPENIFSPFSFYEPCDRCEGLKVKINLGLSKGECTMRLNIWFYIGKFAIAAVALVFLWVIALISCLW